MKGPLVAAVDQPRFVGGHPMAGSEQVGIERRRPPSCSWVPRGCSPPPRAPILAAYARVRAVLADWGPRWSRSSPAEHDTLVAVVSHVPHLTAATLMALATDLEEEHGALLQLAAGGFRDMTRIAAGQPAIWPGICDDNAEAIVSTLDLLIDVLGAMRRPGGRAGPRVGLLGRARACGHRPPGDELPARACGPRSWWRSASRCATGPARWPTCWCSPGELGINIYDLEIAHSVEGDRGVLVVVIDADSAPTFAEALAGRGHRSSVSPVGPGR